MSGHTKNMNNSHTGYVRSVFKVKNVHVNVDSLNFSIRHSKHDQFYKIFKIIVRDVVKRHIQKVVVQAIRGGLEYLDGQLITVRDHVEETKMKEESSSRQVLQDDESSSI